MEITGNIIAGDLPHEMRLSGHLSTKLLWTLVFDDQSENPKPSGMRNAFEKLMCFTSGIFHCRRTTFSDSPSRRMPSLMHFLNRQY